MEEVGRVGFMREGSVAGLRVGGFDTGGEAGEAVEEPVSSHALRWYAIRFTQVARTDDDIGLVLQYRADDGVHLLG